MDGIRIFPVGRTRAGNWFEELCDRQVLTSFREAAYSLAHASIGMPADACDLNESTNIRQSLGLGALERADPEGIVHRVTASALRATGAKYFLVDDAIAQPGDDTGSAEFVRLDLVDRAVWVLPAPFEDRRLADFLAWANSAAGFVGVGVTHAPTQAIARRSVDAEVVIAECFDGDGCLVFSRQQIV